MQLLIGFGMFGGLLAVLSLGVPIAFALLFVALISLFVTGGGFDSLSMVANTYWSSVTTFTLTSVPMFMGAIVAASGMGARLYGALATILDGVPGGLVVATTVACGVMAAVSGSSVATAAAIGGFAVAEMRRHAVPDAQACGAVAGGGTLGILLPPSIPLIIYSIIAEQSIGKLFIATIVPGLIMALAFACFQVFLAMRRSARAPLTGRPRRLATVWERVAALRDIGPFALLILIILGSLYRGLATPQEAASLGIVASLLLAGLVYRELNWERLKSIILTAAQSSAMILAVIASAIVFGYVMTTSHVAFALTNTVGQAHVSPWVLFLSINLLLIFLGFFMETIGIIVVTMPILVPVVQAFHWDLIWFGVIVVINMEMALIHPPVGLNLFVVQSVAPDVPLRRIVMGTLPYVFIMAGVLALVAVFPGLTSVLEPH